jgi:hypothetical protein
MLHAVHYVSYIQDIVFKPMLVGYGILDQFKGYAHGIFFKKSNKRYVFRYFKNSFVKMVMHLLKISIHCFIVDYAFTSFQIQNKVKICIH